MPIDMIFDPVKGRLRTTTRGMISLVDLLAHLDNRSVRGISGHPSYSTLALPPRASRRPRSGGSLTG